MTRPVSTALIRLARIEPEIRLLDLACGTGDPMIRLSPLVGDGGRLVAIDVSSGMLAGTKEKVVAGQIGNVDLAQMDAGSLGFRPCSFDLVTCRFGMMFSPDPLSTLRGIRWLLKPAGRIVIAVWGDPLRNPLFTLVPGILRPFINEPPPEPNPGVPHPLSLGGQGVAEDLLGEAGFKQLESEVVPVCSVHESIEAYVDEWRADGMEGLSRQLRDRTMEEREEVKLAVEASLRRELARHLEAGRVELPGEAICVAGLTPS